MKVDLNLFNSVDTNEKATLIWENGEFIGSRSYYGYTVVLYTMPGFYAEIYYKPEANRIEKIKAIDDHKELEKFLPLIELSIE